jgi:hypothetical protein
LVFDVKIMIMRISDKRLGEFARLFEQKTGRKLSEQETLIQAETLLRTASLLYKPISVEDYCLALIRKMNIKTKNLDNKDPQTDAEKIKCLETLVIQQEQELNDFEKFLSSIAPLLDKLEKKPEILNAIMEDRFCIKGESK